MYLLYFSCFIFWFIFIRKNNNERYYYIRDALGNILGIISQNGQIVVQYSYTSYGVCSISGNTSLGDENPFRYKGYYYDVETGLYWLYSRYYDPEIGRFISPDSVDYLDPTSINGLNLYAYSNNDPVNYCGPSGHFAISALIIGAIIGAAIGFGTAAYADYKEDNVWFNGKLQDYAFEIGLGAITGAVGGGLGSLFKATNFIAGFALSTMIGAVTQTASDYYYGNLSSNSQWYEVLFSGLKGALVGGISYSIAFGVTKFMANSTFNRIIGNNTSNNKINRALSKAGINLKIGKAGKAQIVNKIMNSKTFDIFNTMFS